MTGTIEGTVTDGSDSAIEDVVVTVVGAASHDTVTTTRSDASGSYSVTVAVDTYDLTASKPGYEAGREDNVNVSSSGTTTVDFSLPEATPKVVGEQSTGPGIGVLGSATGTTGTSIGVKGEVAQEHGYGLYTPDDARVDGAAELATLAGDLTGGTPVSDLLGPGLVVDAGTLSVEPDIKPTIVQTATPAVAEAGAEWKRLDDRGTQVWQHSHHASASDSVFHRNGVVYSAGDTNKVVAADAAHGSQLWEHTHHGSFVRTVYASDGTVYSGGGSTVVAADAADGSHSWDHTHHGDTVTSVHEWGDTVYSGDWGGRVVAAGAPAGAKEWEHSLHSQISPTVNSVFAGGGVVYSGASASVGGEVVAANAADGSERWTVDHPTGEVKTVFARDGVVYTGDDDDTVIAMDADDGSVLWEHSHHSNNVKSVFERDGVLYSGALDDRVIAVDAADGTHRWSHSLHGDVVQSVHERNGIVYSAGYDGAIRAVVSDPASYVSDGSEWLFQSRLVDER